MKKIVLLLFLFSILGCEKDDICDSSSSTTPRVIIEFYDFGLQTNLKNVINLKVTADNQVDSLEVFNNKSKIELPLKTASTSTRYSLIINSLLPASANEDFIEFNYTTNTVFVSRACGYKITYNLNDTNGVVLTDAATPDGNWIKDIDILTTTINDEKTTHIKIYF